MLGLIVMLKTVRAMRDGCGDHIEVHITADLLAMGLKATPEIVSSLKKSAEEGLELDPTVFIEEIEKALMDIMLLEAQDILAGALEDIAETLPRPTYKA
jgi:hypothetical protein